MIRLDVSERARSLRSEFRAWLAGHAAPSTGGDPSLETFMRVGRSWQRELAAGSWVGVHWPKEFGGRGLSLVEEAVVQEELVRAGSPQLLGLFGLTMVGPVLIAHGTEEQKKRFLSKILSAEEIWCQGFSEPGAGSDLAAVKTRAVISPEGFTLTGQKIWTSFAHVADWCFVLCRTSDEKEKHKGLSYLLVDMKSKGISTRPLTQISGDKEFNEVFFDNVFVPKDRLVGAVGEGWRIAIATLMYERVVLTFARQLQSEVLLRSLLSTRGSSSSPQSSTSIRADIAKEISKACAMRALSYEHLSEYASGKKPGPEGSLDKLMWSESFQSLCKLAVRLNGQASAVSENADGNQHPAAVDLHRYLYSRGRTIAAGSSEIQRSIIAERVLGLPRLNFSKAG
jgi:alkylation response protein AidB-like acyl-CoA dehydrogenase